MATAQYAFLNNDSNGSGTVDDPNTGATPPGWELDTNTFGAGDSLTVGENVQILASLGQENVTGEYIGLTAAGDPIFNVASVATPSDFSIGDTFILSNSDLTGVSTIPDSTGEYFTCFAAGTGISVPGGTCAVETLSIGDEILTADGRAVPVKWIGRQTVQKLFAGERARPVRVAAGALGDGVPHTDLILTADHALIIDGLAIIAGALVNGTSIAFDSTDSLPDRVTYYHVETEEHDVILANGAAAETYVDYVQRKAFDNYQEYVDLYGEERTITEMDMPRVSAARLVPLAIKARLADESAA